MFASVFAGERKKHASINILIIELRDLRECAEPYITGSTDTSLLLSVSLQQSSQVSDKLLPKGAEQFNEACCECSYTQYSNVGRNFCLSVITRSCDEINTAFANMECFV